MSKKLRSHKINWLSRKTRSIVFISIFASIGVLLLLISDAAIVVNTSAEVEDGQISNCASEVDDTTASGSKAVEFANCNTTTYGDTIPDTNYAIPAGTIFMATNGVDTASGTQAAPVKTLGTAITKVASGGTIVARTGVYRDSASPVVSGAYKRISKQFTLQPYPHEQVWFDGTDVVTNWTSDGAGRWYVDWNTPDYCHLWGTYPAGGYYNQIWPWQGTPAVNGPCIHFDMAQNGADADPQMVFKNGTELKEVTSIGSLDANNFFYDFTNKRVYINADPSGATLEITKRPTALIVEGGSGGQIIRGIGFRRYASNEKADSSYTTGAVFIGAPNVTFEKVVFTKNAGGGLAITVPTSADLESNIFAYNGYDGAQVYGGSSDTSAHNMVMANNVFYGNNTALFGAGCSASCGHAGIKMTFMNGYTLKNNLFQDQKGTAHGFWCDIDCRGGVHVNNLFINNGGAGLFYEISSSGVIASNVFVGNKRYGIKMGSATTRIYNNTMINDAVSALIYDDNRLPGEQGAGPDTVNIDFFNNVAYSTATTGYMIQSWRTGTNGTNTGPDTFYSGYNYNSYFRSGTGQKYTEWRDATTKTYTTLDLFRADHPTLEANNLQDVTDGTDPFNNLASGDYTFKSGALLSGKALPSDIAAMIGTTAGSTNRGAIRWWPNGN